MKPLSEVAPCLLVIQINFQAVHRGSFCQFHFFFVQSFWVSQKGLVNNMEILYFLDQEQSRRAPEQTKVQRRSTTCRYKSHTCVLTGYPFAEHRFVIFETLFVQIPFPFMCNHVKQGVFSKGTVLCGGCWLWAR